jgi:hypothetical protein
MSKYKIIINLSIILTIFLTSCNTNKSNENATKTDADSTKEQQVGVNENILSKRNILEQILNSDKGERVGNIGKSLKDAFSSEVLPAIDSASNYTAFTQYFNNSEDEFVDIQYFHNGTNVTALNLDVYLNNEADVSLLFDQLNEHFVNKYGKATVKTKENTWKLKSGLELKLKDVSLKLASGLQVTFSKKGEELSLK